jgi:hypothetical protein
MKNLFNFIARCLLLINIKAERSDKQKEAEFQKGVILSLLLNEKTTNQSITFFKEIESEFLDEMEQRLEKSESEFLIIQKLLSNKKN